MATEHEIKLIATVDTSQVNGQAAGMHASSGGSRQSLILTVALVAASAQIAKSATTFVTSIKAMQLKLAGLMTAFLSLLANIQAVNENIRSIYAHLKGLDAWSISLSKSAKTLVDSSIEGSNALAEAVKNASNDLNNLASSANNAALALNRAANSSGGGGALDTLGGKFSLKSGLAMFGRFAGWGAVAKSFTSASSTLEQIDPEEKTFASGVFRKLPRAIGDIATIFTTKFARDALEAKKAMDEANAALEESREFFKHLNAEIKAALFDKYVRESKEAIKVLSGDGLSEFVDEHRTKLDALKEKYNLINDLIARGDVGRNIDDLKKQMADIASEISSEQEIYDLASKKMEEAAEAAKKLAEETENLNKAFEKQQQSYQDTLLKEIRDEQRRTWKYGNINDIIKDKAAINAEFNKAREAIQAIDQEIARLKEFYSLQTSNEGRKNIIDKINDLIGLRSRLTGLKGLAQSDIDAINNILKSFLDAADALRQKAKDLIDSDEFKEWKASLKGLSRSELERQLAELKEQREEYKQTAVQDYEKAAEAQDKPTQDAYKKWGEEAERMMKDADARIAELESALKGKDVKLEDPTDLMTSMGKIGMYMSMNEATLQDPKLEKLDHISLTLVQIERNTSQGTVSRFL